MRVIQEPDQALAMHRLMVLSRCLDEICCRESPHWFPSEGEEAVPVGAFYGLRPEDVCAPNYRGAPVVYLMRGVSLEQVWAGILGKRTGFVRGRRWRRPGGPPWRIRTSSRATSAWTSCSPRPWRAPEMAGRRLTFGEAIRDEMRRDGRIFLLGQDIGPFGGAR